MEFSEGTINHAIELFVFFASGFSLASAVFAARLRHNTRSWLESQDRTEVIYMKFLRDLRARLNDAERQIVLLKAMVRVNAIRHTGLSHDEITQQIDTALKEP